MNECQIEYASALRGRYFEYIKSREAQQSEADLISSVSAILPFDESEVLDLKIHQPDSNDASVALKANVLQQNLLKKLADIYIISLFPMNLFEIEKPEERKSALRFNYPLSITDTIAFTFNFDLQFDTQLPEPVLIHSKIGEYSLELIENTDNEIVMLRKFILKKGEWKQDNYPLLYSFLESVNEAENKSLIVLNPENEIFDTDTPDISRIHANSDVAGIFA